MGRQRSLMTETLDRIYSRKSAAEALSVSVKTVIRLELAGKLRRVQVTQGRVGYRESELNRYMACLPMYHEVG